MAFDVFAKFDGIPGESTDNAHQDWIEIVAFDHRIHQPASATASSAGGASAERCEHADFVVTKLLDKASPKLYEACCTGQHVGELLIECCRAGGDKLKYMEIKLEEVIITDVQPSAHSQGDSSFPTEKIACNYGKIQWTYTQQKRTDGSGGGNVVAGWDCTANMVYS